MGIMDLFRGGQSSAQPNPSQTAPGQQPNMQPQPGNLPQAVPPMLSGGSADGQIPGGEAKPKEEVSPFAEFEKLWDTPTLPDGQTPDAPIKFNIDPAKVNQSAKGIDFTKTITPALLEKINGGGEGAMQAMLAAINEVGQAVFAQTMMANTKILETGLESGHNRVQRTLPEAVRKQTIGQALREDNPLFNNPATAPMLSMLENQLTAQFPNATTAEIKTHAKKYLSTFASEVGKINAPSESLADKKQAKRYEETDWSTVSIE